MYRTIPRVSSLRGDRIQHIETGESIVPPKTHNPVGLVARAGLTISAERCPVINELDNMSVVIIHRRGAEDVALIAATELSSLLETAHLLRSPKNAKRLLTALTRAQQRTVAPQSVESLRREFNLDDIT